LKDFFLASVPVNIDCLEESTKHIQGPLTQIKGIEQEITFHGCEFMVNEEDESILVCNGMLTTILIIITIKIKFWLTSGYRYAVQ